jgi:hypothetical protein
MLGFPLVTVLALGEPSASSALLASSLVLVFFLHEPLLVVLGRRGPAHARNAGAAARRALVLLGPVAAFAATAGLVFTTWEVRAWAGGALLVAAVLAHLIATKQEKTFFGEVFVAASFALAAVPIGTAAQLSPLTCLKVAATWTCVFVLGTACVHALLQRFKRQDFRAARAVISAALSIVIGSAGIALYSSAEWTLAVIPTALVSAGVLLSSLTPKRLRVLGWTLITANAVTLAMLLALL